MRLESLSHNGFALPHPIKNRDRFLVITLKKIPIFYSFLLSYGIISPDVIHG
jgi:hypothetical protein